MPRLTDIVSEYRRPKALVEGATIAITAPSSQFDIERVSRGVNFLKELGFNVVLGDTVQRVQDTDFTAAPAKARIDELHALFTDKTVDAIFTACGGYGTQTILDDLDYNLIAANPKIIMGFSDATALLNAISDQSKIYTFLGPTVEIVNKEVDEYCLKKALKLLTLVAPWGVLENPANGLIRRFSNPYRKVSSGRLTGGNLTMMAVLMGTKFEINTDNKIILIEEVGETPYEIERTLQHLEMGKKFSGCAGIIIGEFSRLNREKFDGKAMEGTPSVHEILKKYLERRQYPVLTDYRFSHGAYNMVLPIGSLAKVDANSRTLSIVESVVES